MSSAFQLPDLPYSPGALEPYISEKTLGFHYGKHHQAYIDNLNSLLEAGDPLKGESLLKVVQGSDGALFNNAAQSYNHSFYWHCMAAPSSSTAPSRELLGAIESTFGSLDELKAKFSDLAKKHFGSGWVWLTLNQEGQLELLSLHDADTPIERGHIPLIAIDVWEHSYYLDYQNRRPDYIESFWNLINWDFASDRFAGKDLLNLRPGSSKIEYVR